MKPAKFAVVTFQQLHRVLCAIVLHGHRTIMLQVVVWTSSTNSTGNVLAAEGVGLHQCVTVVVFAGCCGVC